MGIETKHGGSCCSYTEAAAAILMQCLQQTHNKRSLKSWNEINTNKEHNENLIKVKADQQND